MYSFYLTLCCLVPGDDQPIASEPAPLRIIKETPDAARKVTTHAYRWVRGDDPDQVHLYDGKVQVGTWCYAEAASLSDIETPVMAYHPYDGKRWSARSELPIGAPKPPARPKTGPKRSLVMPRPC